MTTGERIKAARKAAGMTQKELGEKMGLSFQSIAQWENDLRKPKFDTIERIAAVLGVMPWDLLPEEKLGAAIAAHVIKKAGLTVKDKDGNILHQGDGRKWGKISEAEANRLGILKFASDKERTIFFYNRLNEDGKRVAGECFFEYLGDDVWKEVADYVAGLSENPLYQKRPSQPPQDPSPQAGETTPENGESPPESPTEQKKEQ